MSTTGRIPSLVWLLALGVTFAGCLDTSLTVQLRAANVSSREYVIEVQAVHESTAFWNETFVLPPQGEPQHRTFGFPAPHFSMRAESADGWSKEFNVTDATGPVHVRLTTFDHGEPAFDRAWLD